MTLRLIIIAVIPTILFALLIYLTDRYDREPISILIKVFVMGLLAIVPTIFVEKILLHVNIFKGIFGIVFSSFVVAGFTEEFFKRKVVLKTVFKKNVFNEKLDGIIYCIFASLGFATIENIIYVVFRFSANYYVGLHRGIFSVPAHLLFGTTMGYYISMGKFSIKQRNRKIFLRKSLTIPSLLHGIFDFILMAQKTYIAVLFLPFVVYLWLINLRKLNKYYNESKIEFKALNNIKINKKTYK